MPLGFPVIDTTKLSEKPDDMVWTRIVHVVTEDGDDAVVGVSGESFRHRRDMKDLEGTALRAVIRTRSRAIVAESREMDRAFKKERESMERRHADEFRALAARRMG